MNLPTASNPVFIPDLLNGVQYTIQLVAIGPVFNSYRSNSITGIPIGSVNPTEATLFIDPSNSVSYPEIGSQVSNIGSAGALQGTMRNIKWISSSKVFYFSFPSSYIEFPAYDFGHAITVTAWINPRSTTNAYQFSVLLGAANFNIGWNSYALGLPPSKSLLLRGSGIETDSSDNVVVYGQWQHVGYVFDPVGATILCFVNGVPTTMNSGIATAPTLTSGAPFYIGAQTDGSNSMTAFLGYIRAYGYRFTATDMFSEYMNTKGRFGL